MTFPLFWGARGGGATCAWSVNPQDSRWRLHAFPFHRISWHAVGGGGRAGLEPGRLTLGALVFQRRARGAGAAGSVQGTG